jgi:hypothetical protein
VYPSLYSRAHSFILSPGLVNKPKWSVIKEKIALAQLVVDERTLAIGKWYATTASMEHGAWGIGHRVINQGSGIWGQAQKAEAGGQNTEDTYEK